MGRVARYPPRNCVAPGCGLVAISIPIRTLLLLFVLALLFSIPTIIPEGGSFLFIFAASAISFFTPGLVTSATLRSFTWRTPLPVPSSSFSGSGSAAPRMNANVTCSSPTMKQHRGPFESNDGIFHGFTYSSPPLLSFSPVPEPPSLPSQASPPSSHNHQSKPLLVSPQSSASAPPTPSVPFKCSLPPKSAPNRACPIDTRLIGSRGRMRVIGVCSKIDPTYPPMNTKQAKEIVPPEPHSTGADFRRSR